MATDPRPAERTLDDLLPAPVFREVHRRRLDLPVERVWPSVLAVRTREVRLLGPLMAVRDLPTRLRRTGPATPDGDRADAGGTTMLAELAAQGFLPVRVDPAPTGGRALALVCGAGRFWSLTDDAAVPLATAEDFLTVDRPGIVRVATSLEVVQHADHTELVTETRIAGTDAAADRTFRRYWAVIRGPSGLIRRSWLAAIERHARSAAAAPSPSSPSSASAARSASAPSASSASSADGRP